MKDDRSGWDANHEARSLAGLNRVSQLHFPVSLYSRRHTSPVSPRNEITSNSLLMNSESTSK